MDARVEMLQFSVAVMFHLCTVSKELFGACIIIIFYILEKQQKHDAQSKTRLNLMTHSSLINCGFLRN